MQTVIWVGLNNTHWAIDDKRVVSFHHKGAAESLLMHILIPLHTHRNNLNIYCEIEPEAVISYLKIIIYWLMLYIFFSINNKLIDMEALNLDFKGLSVRFYRWTGEFYKQQQHIMTYIFSCSHNNVKCNVVFRINSAFLICQIERCNEQ